MLSRIADSLFWLNRYIERSDSILRVVYVHYILSLDRSATTITSWRPVLELCTADPSNVISEIENDTPAALKKILLDETNFNSIRSIVNKARENARGAQDHITKEVWEVVNQMYHAANEPTLPSKLATYQAIKVIEAFSRSAVLFTGITDNTMSRGLGWNFMLLGKFIERCLQTISITDKQLQIFSSQQEEINDILQWRYLLLCLSGYEMHLKTYHSTHHIANALHQIFLNENFTRSIIYSLVRVKHYLENIQIIHEGKDLALERSIGRLHSKVQYMDLQTFNLKTVQQFLHEIKSELSLFSEQLGQYYFSYY